MDYGEQDLRELIEGREIPEIAYKDQRLILDVSKPHWTAEKNGSFTKIAYNPRLFKGSVYWCGSMKRDGIMDAFKLRERLVRDYRSYVEGFLNIADGRIRETVGDAYDQGLLWPEPLIQLNPNFTMDATIDSLVAASRIHKECGRIFRVGKNDARPEGFPLTLYRHQAEALDAALSGDNYSLGH